MRLLVLGGTRFLGKRLAALGVAHGHDVTVSSRRARGAPSGSTVLAGERCEVLSHAAAVAGFDVVVDFTAYELGAAEQALAATGSADYLLVSSTWLTRLKPAPGVDQLPDPTAHAPADLPPVTRTYLAGKAGAERVVAAARLQGRQAAVVRLPILVGAGDHTGRMDFYRRRVLDGGPVILVDGGANRAALLWVEDAAAALLQGIEDRCLVARAVNEGLPGETVSVEELVGHLASAEGRKVECQAVPRARLERALPEYLDEEPLWRETAPAATSANLFWLCGRQPSAVVRWCEELARVEPVSEASGLRERERALLARREERG